MFVLDFALLWLLLLLLLLVVVVVLMMYLVTLVLNCVCVAAFVELTKDVLRS